MNDLFQKLKAGTQFRTESSAQSLSLAAFGKHPGWNDHFEGIGVDTDALVQVKQTLYEDGIGGQINSGAWENLSPEKRLDGFHHTFLWLFGHTTILGEMWSSSDGKGRSKYPMVVCVEAAGLLCGSLTAETLVELESLRGDCKATNVADQVKADCLAARDRLRSQFGAFKGDDTARELTAEAKQRFLEHKDFGPARLGLQRVQHGLGDLARARSHDQPSIHLRVPLAGETRLQACQAWAAFLECALPAATPLLLISRRGSNWLDIIVGKPAAGDFFCLQASPQALPFTTEIPYDLSPSSKTRLQEWEAHFLGADASGDSPSAPLGNVQVKRRSVARRLAVVSLVILLGIVLAGAFTPFGQTFLNNLLMFFRQMQSQSGPSAQNNAAKPGRDTLLDKQLQDGLAAFGRQDYTDALAMAQAVLAANSNSAAANLKTSALQALGLIAAREKEKEAVEQQRYGNAMDSSRSAYDRKDYTNAMLQADVALGIRTNDVEAAKLKSNAKTQLDSLAANAREAAQLRQKYEEATNRAVAALARQDFEDVINQTTLALRFKPEDAAAEALMKQGRQGLAAQQEAQAKPVPAQQPETTGPPGLFTNRFGMQFVWVPALPGGGGYVEKFEVTQRQFQLAMSRLPVGQLADDDELPVANVPLEDAAEFCARLSKWDGKQYTLPTRGERLTLAGLSAAEAQDAWQVLAGRGVLDKEVTSWKASTKLTQPARGGSRGAQTNGICDLLGNLREWDAEKESAGFSYDAPGSGNKKNFFTAGRAAREMMPVTGFRCIMRMTN